MKNVVKTKHDRCFALDTVASGCMAPHHVNGPLVLLAPAVCLNYCFSGRKRRWCVDGRQLISITFILNVFPFVIKWKEIWPRDRVYVFLYIIYEHFAWSWMCYLPCYIQPINFNDHSSWRKSETSNYGELRLGFVHAVFLRNLHSSPDVWVYKSTRMRLTGHVTRLRRNKKCLYDFGWKSKGGNRWGDLN
jgi:hypothetical protein